ncbi:MAG: transposase, partial [Methylocella sp.]
MIQTFGSHPGRGCQTTSDLFWYSDEQWGKVEPHLPAKQQGPARHDDRRILSGIMHVQR